MDTFPLAVETCLAVKQFSFMIKLIILNFVLQPNLLSMMIIIMGID